MKPIYNLLKAFLRWMTWKEHVHNGEVRYVTHHEDISFGTPGIFTTKVLWKCRTCGEYYRKTFDGKIPARVFEETP